MRASSFFHVCLGILAFAAAYHLGARSATAQSPGMVVAGDFDNVSGTRALAIVGRMLYTHDDPVVSQPIPGTASVVAVSRPNAGILYMVLLDDGSVWGWNQSAWVFVRNVIPGATPPRQESMGAVKARYR